MKIYFKLLTALIIFLFAFSSCEQERIADALPENLTILDDSAIALEDFIISDESSSLGKRAPLNMTVAGASCSADNIDELVDCLNNVSSSTSNCNTFSLEPLGIHIGNFGYNNFPIGGLQVKDTHRIINNIVRIYASECGINTSASDFRSDFEYSALGNNMIVVEGTYCCN